MLAKLLVAASLLAASALPSVAQPLAGDPPAEPAEHAVHAGLDAAFEAVAHHGRLVVLWDALPEAAGYVVELVRPGAPLRDALHVPRDAASDAAGYSAALELPDGTWSVRLVAVGLEAASRVRDVVVEAPDAFGRDEAPPMPQYAAGR